MEFGEESIPGVMEFGEESIPGVIGGEPYLDKLALIFEVGITIDGRKVTPAMLDKIMERWKPPASEIDWTVPFQLSHSPDAQASIGNVRAIWRVKEAGKDQVWAKVRIIGQEPVRKVTSGVWRKVSVGLDDKGGLKELTVTPFPAVGAAQVFEANKEDDKMKPETQTAPVAEPQAAVPAVGQDTNFMALIEKQRQEFAEKTRAMEAQLKAAEKALEFQGQQLAQQSKALRFANLTALVDKYSQAGLTTPAMRDPELALLESLSDDQLKLYEALKAQQPQIVHLDTYGVSDVKRPAASTEDDEAIVKEMMGLSSVNNHQKGGK